MPKWGSVHQPGHGGAVHLSVSVRFLGQQLRINAGGADFAFEHGCFGHNPLVSSLYSKYDFQKSKIFLIEFLFCLFFIPLVSFCFLDSTVEEIAS